MRARGDRTRGEGIGRGARDELAHASHQRSASCASSSIAAPFSSRIRRPISISPRSPKSAGIPAFSPTARPRTGPTRSPPSCAAAASRSTDAPRPTLGPPSAFRPPLDLRPYQDAALAAWRLAARRGLIALPTGSGKTHVALAAIAATRAPCLCLVPTRALLAQWLAALAAVYDGPIGRFGDGERVLAPLTVATFAGAYRHMARIGDRFGLLDRRRGPPLRARHPGRGARDVDRAAPPRAHRHAARARTRRHAPRHAARAGRVRALDRRSRRPLPGAARADHLAPRARRRGAARVRRAPRRLPAGVGRVPRAIT